MKTNQEILVQNGVSPSIQRLKIFSYLKATKSHPTAYTIFNDLKDEIPSLSKTTVYNVLKLLIAKRLVQEVRIEGNELRYDAEVREHGHFKCDVCGEVSDVFLNQPLNLLLNHSYEVKEIQFNITGVCKSCLTKK
ncbi:MAG: transcriptional repressor [Bacteroidales bacterium]|nr:transcriptional repressor [Bacteroidales bacterium]